MILCSFCSSCLLTPLKLSSAIKRKKEKNKPLLLQIVIINRKIIIEKRKNKNVHCTLSTPLMNEEETQKTNEKIISIYLSFNALCRYDS